MAILIDPPAWPAHGTLWSHLVSDTDYDELHAFAKRLGLPRRGFDLDHYDLPASRYADAVQAGARAVSGKDVVHELRRSGLRVRQVEKAAIRPLRRREYLRAEWRALGDAIDIAGVAGATHRPRAQTDAWLDLGDDLLARYGEPHRRYHDEHHLEDVLLALDHLATRGERLSPATLLAAWFHDAVYTGGSGANGGADTDEQASARLATRALGDLGLAPGLVSEVSGFIVATTPAGGASGSLEMADPPAPLAHLLDADLSIFASPQQRYEQYALAVRAEYAHVADADFALRRSRILASYIERPAIYRTPAARQLWEQRARENVSAEIARLTARP